MVNAGIVAFVGTIFFVISFTRLVYLSIFILIMIIIRVCYFLNKTVKCNVGFISHILGCDIYKVAESRTKPFLIIEYTDCLRKYFVALLLLSLVICSQNSVLISCHWYVQWISAPTGSSHTPTRTASSKTWGCGSSALMAFGIRNISTTISLWAVITSLQRNTELYGNGCYQVSLRSMYSSPLPEL